MSEPDLWIEYRPLREIEFAPRNPRDHDLGALHSSLDRFGAFTSPVLQNEATGRLVAGHGRVKALRQRQEAGGAPPRYVRPENGDWLVPVVRGLSFASEQEAEAYLLADNRITNLATDDDAMLAQMLQELAEQSSLEGTGYDTDDLDDILARLAAATGAPPVDGQAPEFDPRSLAERFVVPPFTVLDGRQGYWRERKRSWLALGIESELGRGNERDRYQRGLTYAVSSQSPHTYTLRNIMREKLGRDPTWDEIIAEALKRGHHVHTGTSAFDPVVCELAYRWLCPPGGRVLDPFAGGSVRGIVAGWLGRHYLGIDLSERQVAANRTQADLIIGADEAEGRVMPQWQVGDGADVASLAEGPFDLLFTCPPYADLERYSDDPRDLSTMKYPAFLRAYRAIIGAAAELLDQDRFAAIVVAEVRDTKARDGKYRNFIADTIQAFSDAGLSYYNEAILVNPISSAAIRAGNAFLSSRKLCKVHQQLLVFVKGDPRTAAEAIGETEFEEPLVLSETPGEEEGQYEPEWSDAAEA